MIISLLRMFLRGERVPRVYRLRLFVSREWLEESRRSRRYEV